MTRVADEWFRTSAWDAAARQDFERRLERSRAHTRPQYLRIKGLALIEAGNEEAAMELFQRVLRDHPGSLDCRMALETMAGLERKQGNPLIAERLYRDLLKRWPDLNATTGMANVSLAELLLEKGGRDSAEEALQQLQAALARPGGVTLNANLFRWHVTLVRAAEAIGDTETTKRA